MSGSIDKKQRKVLVIGLDGATFTVLNPLIAKGIMPNLGEIITEGVSAPLLSTIPPVTGPAWVSFMTGKNPDKHGIFDFVRPAPGDFKRQVINYNCIKSQTLWSILTNKGKKIGVINVPVTYPPPEVDGFVISGMLTPRSDTKFTYPAALYEELQRDVGGYVIDAWPSAYGRKGVERALRELLYCTRQRSKASLYLMQNKKWDFFMTVFVGMDRIQHVLWRYLTGYIENKPQTRKEKRIAELILKYYREVDKYIGQVKSMISNDTNVILVSDHGFGNLNRVFNINSWLIKEGLLVLDEEKVAEYKLMKQKRRQRSEIIKFIVRLDAFDLRRKIIPQKYRKRKRSVRLKRYDFLEFVDWSKTKAYSVSGTEQGIYINLKGRYPYGIVNEGQEYEELKNRVLNSLRSVADPEINEKIVDIIYKKEELYRGPHAQNAPDIIFLLKGGYVAKVEPGDCLFEASDWSPGDGTHRMDGILIGYGADIKRQDHSSPARIIDVAPTILYLMGLPIPSDMDGKVIEKVIHDDFIKDHPVQFVEPDQADYSLQDAEDVYSEDDTEEIKNKLKALGYV